MALVDSAAASEAVADRVAKVVDVAAVRMADARAADAWERAEEKAAAAMAAEDSVRVGAGLVVAEAEEAAR